MILPSLSSEVSPDWSARRNACCDVCGKWPITGARVVCLDCEHNETLMMDSIDLCGTQECMGNTCEREDLKSPHIPEHRIVKVRSMVRSKNYGTLYRAAMAAFEEAQNIYKTLLSGRDVVKGNLAVDSQELPSDTTALCAICDETLAFPFWYCTECKGKGR